MKIAFPLSVQPGKWVLELHDMGKNFGEKVLFKNINITVGRGEKIALLGPNGVGKSTLLKRIMGVLDGEGMVKLGHNVQITYFAQDQAESLDPNKTVFDTVDEIATGDARRDLRSLLGAFLFSGEDIDKKVGVLSGGERTRLALCQLLLSPSNFLILDEPTNHLDIQSKDVLKQALQNYEGTFIVVSHDREFLEGLTNRIWDIENKGLKIHHFGVQEFLRRKMTIETALEADRKSQDSKQEKNVESLNYEATKELKRKKNQLSNQIKRIEDAITKQEDLLKQLDERIAALDYSNETESSDVLTKYELAKNELDDLMNQWEQATEELIALD
jgi:ATP-binding cassette subfamily F protein 3